MRKINSQIRETMEESGLRLVKRVDADQVILADIQNNFALYGLSDNFSGHVIELEGKGYEFISSNNRLIDEMNGVG
jgi:hypothetical protein